MNKYSHPLRANLENINDDISENINQNANLDDSSDEPLDDEPSDIYFIAFLGDANL